MSYCQQCAELAIEVQQLREQVQFMKETLDKLSGWGDANANTRLALSGSFSCFDDPYSVEIARKCLAATNAGAKKGPADKG